MNIKFPNKVVVQSVLVLPEEQYIGNGPLELHVGDSALPL